MSLRADIQALLARYHEAQVSAADVVPILEELVARDIQKDHVVHVTSKPTEADERPLSAHVSPDGSQRRCPSCGSPVVRRAGTCGLCECGWSEGCE